MDSTQIAKLHLKSGRLKEKRTYDLPAGSPARKASASEAMMAWKGYSIKQEKRANKLHGKLLAVTDAYKERVKETDGIEFEIPDLSFSTPETEVFAALDKMAEQDRILRDSLRRYET